MNQKGFVNIIVIIVSLAIIGGLSYLAITKKAFSPFGCTLDAKVCPDGSTVGRVGPNCEFSPCALSGGIKIISPVAGDKWVQGKTYQIKWTGGNSKTSLWIFIPTADGKNRTIAPMKTPNNGLYSWSISESFPTGKYKMQFEFSNGSGNVLRVESDYFEIVSSDQSSKKIKVTSPVSGDTWTQGETHKIKWTGGAEKISIYLIDKSLEVVGGSVSKTWIVDNIENKGYYDFGVTGNFGGTYRFYISDNEGNFAYSDYFAIVSSRQPF